MLVPEPLITTSPDRLSGTPVFAGTRVPVQTLIDYLEAGDHLEAFLARRLSQRLPRTRRGSPRAREVCAAGEGRSRVAARRPPDADSPRCLCSEEPSQQPRWSRSPNCPRDGL